MKYSHILSYVARTPWAIAEDKMHEILSVLAFRASGGTFTPAEIEARIGGGSSPAQARTQGAVAVIPIRGVIAHRMGSMDDTSGGTSTERIGAMLKQVASDESVGTIVYDIDSPGGTVPGVQELAAQMFALRGVKRQVAQVNSLAASAAYWLASQADEIVSIPSGMAGSIGVFTVLEDLSAALEKEGVKVDVIRAGKYKAEGNPFEPLSDEGRAHIQGQVDTAYAQFVKDVARGRGVSVADVKAGYGEGRALTAQAAKAARLIDRIDTLDGTLAKLTGRRAGMRADAAFIADIEAADRAFIEGTGSETPVGIVAHMDMELAEADRRRRLERF